MQFGHKHYIPILKAKAGESWALRHLQGITKSGLTPLLELVPIPRNQQDTRSTLDHIAILCDGIVTAWGTSQPFYLDPRWLQPSHGDASVLTAAFAAARSRNLVAIPVAYPSFTPASLNSIAAIAATDGRGAMVRMTRDYLGSPHVINLVAAGTGLPISSLDLMLDYRNSQMSLSVDVPHLPAITTWRTFSAASGVFPPSLSSLPQATWSQVPRPCYASWLSDISSGALARKPAFSDYTVRDPGQPASGGDPPVTMRYTASGYWLAQIHGSLQNGNAPNMVAICSDLVSNRPEWCGSTFSMGDDTISLTGSGLTNGPGGGQQWVQWAISHHMEFVVKREIVPLP